VNRKPNSVDAIALLKADHRQVAKWFAEFDKARKGGRKERLAAQICAALRVHAKIEEEIFYPAFIAATGDKDLHHEAEVEHAGAKHLIGQIEGSDAGDDYFEAKVTVLSEMIKHHVKEEEQPGGMFAKARKSGMDLAALGRRLKIRKLELEKGAKPDGASANTRRLLVA
jgi:hypothetical protein